MFASAGLLAQHPLSKVEKWTDKRVRDNLPTKTDRRLEEVGWADVLEAKALSKRHNRPLFLFEFDGDIGSGRC